MGGICDTRKGGSFFLGLPNITPMASKVHVILRRSAVRTWRHDNREIA
jgi:hypothetical protein